MQVESNRSLGIVGVFEFWEDEPLLLLGLHGMTPERPAGRASYLLTTRWGFAAKRQPLLLAIVNLLPGVGLSPLTCSWADGATAVIDGDPASQRVVGRDETWGDLGLKTMLEPSPLAEIVPGPWPSEFFVDGGLVAADPLRVPDFQVKGASHFKASYDAELNVITSWVAEIDGQPARAQKLSFVTSA